MDKPRINKKELRAAKERAREEKRVEEARRKEAETAGYLYHKTFSVPCYADDWPQITVTYTHRKPLRLS